MAQEITGDMIHRSAHLGLKDPCVICGGKFGADYGWEDTCGHTTDEVAAVLKQIKAMGPKARAKLLKG